MSRASILREVSDERDRQDQKWGPASADHVPNGTGPSVLDDLGPVTAGLPYAELAELRKQVCGTGKSFAAILLEEVYEALAESDPFALRRELRQVAAVCVKWMEKLDRVDLAVPDSGGEVVQSPALTDAFGPLVAAPKSTRCGHRQSGDVCLLPKGTHPNRIHRSQTGGWVQEPPR